MTHTTTIKKAAGASNTIGLHADTNGADFRTAGAIEQAHDAKAIATQLAHLALAGHHVIKGQSGDYTPISAAKGPDAEKAVAVFEKAEAALKASKKLISQGLSVNGGQVDDLRKKLNEVLAELDSLEAQISTEGAVLHE